MHELLWIQTEHLINTPRLVIVIEWDCKILKLLKLLKVELLRVNSA